MASLFLAQAAKPGSVLHDIGLTNPTISRFNSIISNKMEEMKAGGLPKDKKKPAYIGGIILHELIKKNCRAQRIRVAIL